MKKAFYLILTIAALCAGITSCQKAPFITMTGPRSYTFTREGGSQSFAFSCNRDWSISSTESWVRISPSSGSASDGDITVTLTVEPNSAYDPRTATVTLVVEDLSERLSINQDTNLGLFASPTTFELSNEEQTISIKAQSNVQYSVEIDDESKPWVNYINTKGLNESSVTLKVTKNDSYDRSGKVVLKSDELQEVIVIKQKSADVVFDDNTFKTYCINNFDKDGDNEVSLTEALDAKVVSCGNMGIKSLTGIESFRNLDTLSCGGNQLTRIDVSSNPSIKTVYCAYNPLSYVNVTGCSELSLFICAQTPLTTLDLGDCEKLSTVLCGNNQLTNINLDGCVSLSYLDCTQNRLQSLDISDCNLLTNLYCSSNQITRLDTSDCNLLTSLNCSSNQITRLDTSMCPQLRSLVCDDNQIIGLDVSNCLELTYLNCSHNQLSTLAISGCISLKTLYCEDNQIEILDTSECAHLETLECSSNRIRNLDLNKSKSSLNQLFCAGNELNTLAVKDCTALKDFECSQNQITNLDLSGCFSLIYLICHSCPLGTLNLTSCSALELLDSSYCSLTSLDLTDCIRLSTLDLKFNKLKLIDVCNNLELQTLDIIGNPDLAELWMKTGQEIPNLNYWSFITTIYYKD